MRAIVLEKFGGLDSLVYKEIPDPEPKAGYVVIEIKAFGLNHAEMHMRRGEWAQAAKVIGIECVGLVKLATELEKDLLIRDLAASGNFARTHTVIAKLSKYTDFTPAQLNAIVEAAVTNSQISLIIDDEDVREFIGAVIKGREKFIEKDNLAMLSRLLSPRKKEVFEVVDDDEIPF